MGTDLVTGDEKELIVNLKKGIDMLVDTMLLLYPVALSVVNLTKANGTGAGKSELILLAGKCLQASEVLKAAAIGVRAQPVPRGDDEGVMW
eukprot:CAMPEP_0119054632 /NCGR_PEP_ID=MMETSP1177-20130426/75204_1 /TAXON_ID=2985 /ORGANISM="Ochromonas sp, Strain CCMP1899" /LENGTH=90 /DNA_ID=CAMNT_0007034943 /DNA_START=511 /DNA_END=780 /DNA_ORIENTATION=-